MAKIRAKGVTIKQGSTAVLQVKRIKPPNTTVETADVTELGDSTRSFLGTIQDNGEVSFDIFFDPDAATHTALRTLLDNQLDSTNALSSTPQSWVITFTDSTPATCTFLAVLTGLDLGDLEIGGFSEATITLKISGALTWA